MINYIMSSDSQVIDVSQPGSGGGYTSGAVYWDANNRQFKIIDSNGNAQSFTPASTNVNVGPKLREMLVWFENKKLEEQQMIELCKQYPNLADAKREFDAIYNLVKEHK